MGYNITMDKTKITITKAEYLRLRIIALEMDFLEIGGVDNWEWYGDSLNPDDSESFEEKSSKLKTEILGIQNG